MTDGGGCGNPPMPFSATEEAEEEEEEPPAGVPAVEEEEEEEEAEAGVAEGVGGGMEAGFKGGGATPVGRTAGGPGPLAIAESGEN